MDIWLGFTYVGALTVTYYFVKLVLALHHNWRVYFTPTYPDFSKFGKWSVVTGSTDGIGKATALQLASHGQNIILIARNEDKLKAVSEEIISKHGVQVKYLKIDFSHHDSIYDEIKEFLGDYDIGVLINNVGMGSPWLPFLEITENIPNFSCNITRINMFSLVKMTEMVLPGMVARRRGLIVNISSLAAVSYLLNIYGAIKAFIHYFSQALGNEYEHEGVLIRSCIAGPVATKMLDDHTLPTLGHVSPEYYAKSMLATVDKERWTYGCWKHALAIWTLQLLPLTLISWQRDRFCESYRKANKMNIAKKYCCI